MRRAVKAAAVLVLSAFFITGSFLPEPAFLLRLESRQQDMAGGLGPAFAPAGNMTAWAAAGGIYGQEETGQSGAGREETRPEEFSLMDFDAEEIDAFLSRASKGRETVSFRELMELLITGNFEQAASGAAKVVSDAFFSEIRSNTALMGQIIVLALAGAVFSSFSEIFGSGHVSETGFYVIYLCIMALLAATFFASIQVADEVTGSILEFMKALLPAYFLAVAMGGGAVTSSAVCGFTFAAVGLVQTVVCGLLLPLMRIYMPLVLAANLFKEDMISQLTELLKLLISWTMKTLFGIVVGFHLIQGLVIPQADALKNTAAMRFVELIPGIGAGAGTISQMVMGSGILIKNTAGAAAVAVLLFLAAVPVLKLLVLMALYYAAAAAMQPVCDKRLVSCMSQTAAGHGMLLKIVGYSLALFAVTIAVLCISTNAAYYAA